MRNMIAVILTTILCTTVAAQQKTVVVSVENTTGRDRSRVPVVVDLGDIKCGFKPLSATVYDGETEIISQTDDLDGDGRIDEVAFTADIAARESRSFRLVISAQHAEHDYKPQVYAQMLLSDKKGKHPKITSLTVPGTSDVYNDLHHHGPAFESEEVIYRIYFDRKQTVDIYGKFHRGFELEESGFYPTDEQLARGFGDDVLRVSGSCGVGTLKGWNGNKATHIDPVESRTERIVACGPLRTVVEVVDKGWRYGGRDIDLMTRYTLYGGHRDVQVDLFFSTPLESEVFCTGVQNIKGSQHMKEEGLVGCWGTDWPVNDTVKYAKETVGLAAFLPREYIIDSQDDKVNYLYQIGGRGISHMRYWITFTSLKETFGYHTPEEWFAHIRRWREELETPCKITIKKKR